MSIGKKEHDAVRRLLERLAFRDLPRFTVWSAVMSTVGDDKRPLEEWSRDLANSLLGEPEDDS